MSARALYPELADGAGADAHAADPDSLPREKAGELLGRVGSNRAGVREVLADRRDLDLEAVRREGGTS